LGLCRCRLLWLHRIRFRAIAVQGLAVLSITHHKTVLLSYDNGLLKHLLSKASNN
jgi:hypothetical protein